MSNTQLLFGVQVLPPVGAESKSGLQISLQSNPLEILITPITRGGNVEGFGIAQVFEVIGAVLDIDALSQLSSLKPPAPWDGLFSAAMKVRVLPNLAVLPVGKDPAVSLRLQLYTEGQGPNSGITIGGSIGSYVTLEPTVTVYEFLIEYSRSGGCDVKARVLFHDPAQSSPQRLSNSDPAPPAGKMQLVSYPFPLADPNVNNSFKLSFLGLGQRFAPPIDVNAADPIGQAMTKLKEVFTSNDPKTVINQLIKYYDPKVGWFFGLDVDIRGFTVRVVFADPVLYGIEVTCSAGQFDGLLAEILYQKIGADLGVFYGKLVLPTLARQINVGAGSATIPSVAAWIYTNGDFKIAVGWPLGPDSFSLQVAIFMGTAGIYIGKLRSGDNPTGRTAPQTTYNPILIFGLAMTVGLGRSFSQGPISAEVSLCLQGVFQGLLAWKAAPPPGTALTVGDNSGIARDPDYYWFSASIGLIGVVQGSVDLGIISATLCIQVWANIATAFETGCNTMVWAHVGVRVDLSIKIVFFRINIHFDATLDLQFILISGHAQTASTLGPSDPDLAAFIPSQQLMRLPLEVRGRPLATAPQKGKVTLQFLLQPTVRYDKSGTPVAATVASLVVACPGSANDLNVTSFELIINALAGWLLTTYGSEQQSWQAVSLALGGGGTAAPNNFSDGLPSAMQGIQFTIEGFDAESILTGNESAVALFPMFDDLVLHTPDGNEWDFADVARTWPGYPQALSAYFRTMSALTPSAAKARATVGANDGPTGPSLARMLFENWYLALSRQMAVVMAKGGNASDGHVPDIEQVADLAGVMSRMFLHGTRVPDPAIIHCSTDPLDENLIHSLYQLNHQQFDVVVGGAVKAGLSLNSGSLFDIALAGGVPQVLSSLAAPPSILPSMPDPWSGVRRLANESVSLSLMDPLHSAPLFMATAARTQVSGVLPTQGAFILPLPVEATQRLGGEALTAAMRLNPQETDPVVAVAGGLLIKLGLRRVPLAPENNVVLNPHQAPSAALPWSKDVYELIGTDDGTRSLLEQLLDVPTSPVQRVLPLFGDANALVCPILDLDAEPVFMFKSNLSTTSQPNSLFKPMLLHLREGADLGPIVASLDDSTGFLRLLWECSVVHASGFYLRFADLPPSLFERDTAPFWIWLDMGVPKAGPALLPYMNSLLVADDGSNAAKSTHYLSLQANGKAVVQFQPAFPPGCLGIKATWNSAPVLLQHRQDANEDSPAPFSNASIEALYHMMAVAIDGAAPDSPIPFATSLWSTPLSPMEVNGNSQCYRQVVPAWQYAIADDGKAMSNPYQTIGAKPQLSLRLGDVYGNALPIGQTLATELKYNDALLSPSNWPGCAMTFSMASTPTAGTSLRVWLRFDPIGLKQHCRSLSDSALGDAAMGEAYRTWSTISAQLNDTNVGAAFSSSLFGDDWPQIGNPSLVKAQLASFVAAILLQFERQQLQTYAYPVDLPVLPSHLCKRTSDIFALGVRLTLQRVGVDPSISERLPAVAQVQATIAPDWSLSTGVPAEPPLQTFAHHFETFFTGYDGEQGQLKLAVRPLSSDGPESPHLWGVRFSESAGIHISQDTATRDAALRQAVHFTMQPFSTKLMYGSTQVTVYDEHLLPSQITSNPVAVDVDALMQQYLLAIDNLLAPESAAGLAGSDKDAFTQIMRAKNQLATILSQRLIPVLLDQSAGDLTQAIDQFNQSLLARLSSAYATASVVQVPLTLTVAGSAEAGSSPPPRLYGGFDLGELPLVSAGGNKPFALTSSKLPLESGPARELWLTFQVTVNNTRQQCTLDLNPTWVISHIEHLFEPDDQKFSYMPSGWLKFVLPVSAGGSQQPLQVELGHIEVPVPLRSYPNTPTLVVQSTQNKPTAGNKTELADVISDVLKWQYVKSLVYPDLAAQDDLWVSATFNHSFDWTPTTDADQGLSPLAQALVRFQYAYGSLHAFPPTPKVAAIWAQLVNDVLDAMQLPDKLAVPVVNSLSWVLRALPVSAGHHPITVFAKQDDDGAGLVWPVINGLSYSGIPIPAINPPSSGKWFQARYDIVGTGVAWDFSFSPFDLLTRQTVIGSVHVVRNADISGHPVNPQLIYTTPELWFPNVLVPYVVVRDLIGPVDGRGKPLADVLTAVLLPLAQAGASLHGTLVLRLSSTYGYTLVQSDNRSLQVLSGAVMNIGQTLTEASLEDITITFASQFGTWLKNSGLPLNNPFLSLAVSLFAEVDDASNSERIPLLRLDQLVIKDFSCDFGTPLT